MYLTGQATYCLDYWNFSVTAFESFQSQLKANIFGYKNEKRKQRPPDLIIEAII